MAQLPGPGRPQPDGSAAVDAVGAVAALDDPVRRRIYAAIRREGRALTREEVARRPISRKLAAFHLEKLVHAGLLRSDLAAESPRKVGRTPKVYAPIQTAVHVSVPARAYGDLASILLDAAVSEPGCDSPQEARDQAAARAGRTLGTEVDRTGLRGRLGVERALRLAEVALAERGYEPYRPGSGSIRLRNCPFHPFADQAPELVCGVNVCFLGGFLEGLGADAVEAVLAPKDRRVLRGGPGAEPADHGTMTP